MRTTANPDCKQQEIKLGRRTVSVRQSSHLRAELIIFIYMSRHNGLPLRP
jgi:hypothetical protein